MALLRQCIRTACLGATTALYRTRMLLLQKLEKTHYYGACGWVQLRRRATKYLGQHQQLRISLTRFRIDGLYIAWDSLSHLP